jgi:hypothetical protein
MHNEVREQMERLKEQLRALIADLFGRVSTESEKSTWEPPSTGYPSLVRQGLSCCSRWPATMKGR